MNATDTFAEVKKTESLFNDGEFMDYRARGAFQTVDSIIGVSHGIDVSRLSRTFVLTMISQAPM